MGKLSDILQFIAPPFVSFGVIGLMIWGVTSMQSCQQDEYQKRQKEYSAIFNQQPISAQVLEEKYMSSLKKCEKEAQIDGSGISVGTGGIGIGGGSGTIKYDGLENKNQYVLKVKTSDGRILGISVLDGPTQTKESLDAIISPGSTISFIPGNVELGRIDDGLIHDPRGYKVIAEETNVTKDTYVANKRADRIKVN